MNQYFKDKLHIKLKSFLNREPSQNERINAENDYGLMMQILLEEIELLKSKVK